MDQQTIEFIGRIKPFDLLPSSDLERVAEALVAKTFSRGAVLFRQKISEIQHLHIVRKGRLERYIEEGGEKRLRTVMDEGEIYGGISMLLNRSMSVRSVEAVEDTVCYLLPKEIFLDLCARYDDFTAHFTTTFGKRMLDRCYAAIIAKTAQADEEDTGLPDFLNRPLEGTYSRDFASCPEDLSIQDAAIRMKENNKSYILVRNREGEFVGLVTDNDLRNKVVAQSYDIHRPIADIMASPLISVPSESQIFEAIMVMIQCNIKHLAVRDEQEKVLGVATDQDILVSQGQSPVFLIHEIQAAKTLDEIGHRHEQLPGLVKTLMESGAKAHHLNRFISEVSDSILRKVMQISLEEAGEPPVRFAFLIFGSEGRKEQTLKTDQDNAIVFEDVPKESEKEVQEYFLKLGEKVCGHLDEVGYSYCEFNVMAKNPDWCQPLEQWKQYFRDWIRHAEPLDLLKSSIFFDFRLGYGHRGLVDELQKHLFETLAGWVGFFRHLSENALEFKPPLDFFGKISVVSKGEHQNKVDIKSAMTLIVDFARIYALQNRVKSTNTLERLRDIQRLGALRKDDHDDLAYVYGFLMQLRLAHQVKLMADEQRKPDNYIDPKSLSYVERQTLREAFKHLGKAQGKLSMDFSGWYTGIG